MREIPVSLTEKQAQEVVGGLKLKVAETQGKMKENVDRPYILISLDIQRRIQEGLLGKLKRELRKLQKNSR